MTRHAYHQIVVTAGECSVSIETRAYGDSPYADGVAEIVSALRRQALDNRTYSIMEFLNNGWL